jgi:hypothetical protein
MTWQTEIMLSVALTEINHYHADKVPLALRDHYPELSGIFDRLDDTPAELQAAVRELEQHRDQLAANMDEMSARCSQLRDMALTLQRFDAAAGIEHELAALADKADLAYEYAEQNK